MADMARSESQVMDLWIQAIRADSPKIDQAVKNLLAVLLSKPAPTGSSSLLNHQSTEEVEEYLFPTQALESARLFLRTLQEHPLQIYDEFCRQVPQTDSQSAIDRLDQVCKYKAVLAVREYVLQEGGKVSKTFGRDYFLSTGQWDSLKQAVRDSFSSLTSAKSTLTEGELDIFLRLFEKSIFAKGEELFD
jgi:hypothetical protein